MRTFITYSIALLSALTLWATPVVVFAAPDGATLTALDTVAHFETRIKGTGLVSERTVNVTLQKPDTTMVVLSAVTDDAGAFSLVVPDEQTRVAGMYLVSLDSSAARTSFKVFPGEMDAKASALYTNRSALPASGSDGALVTVRITDEFGNPLSSHRVSLTSSRSEDRIVSSQIFTDTQGIASFSVTSTTQGVSTLTAMDQSAQTTLDQRLTLSFVRSFTVTKDIGGDPESVLLADAGPSASRFEIENLPATVNINQTVSFRLRAVNSDGTTIPTFTGTVIFSSTDSNAQVPSPYTFKTSDQGQKTFDLGLTFRTLGSKTLVTQQQGNSLIRGEKVVQVVGSQSGSSGQVRITKPAPGTYSVNTLAIEGDGIPNTNVKIFDNGQQIAEVQANISGRFSFNSSLLPDGQHTFQAQGNGVQSDSVIVTIDTTSAQVEQVVIDKTTLGAGETTSISITSDPGLNAVQATVGEFITDLVEDSKNRGTYKGTLTAPNKIGKYTINVIITDKVGNVSPTIQVGSLNVISITTLPGGAASFNVPSKVNAVRASGGNTSVSLTWSPVEAESGIAHYRIYYGTELRNLAFVVNTTDSVTAFEVGGLENNVPYYFQVVGVDTNGNEGDIRSAMVTSTPSANGAAPVLCDPSPCPSAGLPLNIPEDGPEVYGMLVSALMSTALWKGFRRKSHV